MLSFGVAALCYIAALVLLFSVVVIDVTAHGPYVRWYNQRLEKKAIDARLIGSDERLIETTLGPASFVYSYWGSYDA